MGWFGWAPRSNCCCTKTRMGGTFDDSFGRRIDLRYSMSAFQTAAGWPVARALDFGDMLDWMKLARTLKYCWWKAAETFEQEECNFDPWQRSLEAVSSDARGAKGSAYCWRRFRRVLCRIVMEVESPTSCCSRSVRWTTPPRAGEEGTSSPP